MTFLRRSRSWIIVLCAALTLVAASHALQDRAEPAHDHASHGALITCVVTLALVGAVLRLRQTPPRLRAAIPSAGRPAFAFPAAPKGAGEQRPRISPVWLGRFLR